MDYHKTNIKTGSDVHILNLQSLYSYSWSKVWSLIDLWMCACCLVLAGFRCNDC